MIPLPDLKSGNTYTRIQGGEAYLDRMMLRCVGRFLRDARFWLALTCSSTRWRLGAGSVIRVMSDVSCVIRHEGHERHEK